MEHPPQLLSRCAGCVAFRDSGQGTTPPSALALTGCVTLGKVPLCACFFTNKEKNSYNHLKGPLAAFGDNVGTGLANPRRPGGGC